ncbi:MAG: sulfurtransferase-like selenium metabolism protein YedF [Synergistaceae bacterium]|jgi:selenium metabolism protein YedF|nr:sulfurtransferase-like selenium metabolism protein YedF [Synergistaceae bacterium]
MKTIDMIGQPCPIPVINAKKALAETGADGVVVLVDNMAAVQNLEKMARGYGCRFSYKEDGPARYSVSIGGDIPPEAISKPRESEAPHTPATGAFVVMIGADHLGEGSDELGKMLIKGFIFSLTQLAAKPEAVIFLNGGARLTSEGSNAVPDLKTLSESGVKILTCGTCVNYYGLGEKLAVGEITDMMGIVNLIAAAGRLIAV